MDIENHGLVVFRASRLEALLEPLAHLLRALPPDGALTPQTVIAAHPGMRQWLTRALSREAGPRGIVANLDIVLPSAWLDTLARTVLGEAAVALAPYRREALRWRVFAQLQSSDDMRVQAYLAGNDGSRRRFQLADRIASLFTRYLVYRSDWLAAWAEGRDGVPEPTLLASLWREARAGIGAPHRGERLDALLHQLRRLPDGVLPSEPLHLFGLSHLAPQEMSVLRAVARLRPVVLYLPDPCRDYWAGLRPERARLRELARLPPQAADTERVFLEELGHPLLASWGRQGQQFVLALSGDEDVLADIRDGRDEAGSDHPTLLLDRLQEGIRRLQPQLLRPYAGMATQDDRSLRVHSCHTRLRELEVLRDALLRAREDDPDILPSDMAVLAPDIQGYAPLIPAVFGVAGDSRSALPYHLADVALLHSHALLIAFARLLDVPGSRLSAAQVLDVLSVPAVQRALGLDSAGVEQLGAWLTEARVAWALDGAAKQAFGVPTSADHSFAWGMDRLLAGYVLGQIGGDTPQVQEFVDGSVVVPLAGVQGPQCEALGTLDRLLRELALLQGDAMVPRALSAWSARLEQLIDAVFRIDLRDASENDALNVLRRLLRSLGSEAIDAGADPAVDFDVVRELLQERMAAPAERQPFLLGGVTFCGMVPQRAIPFKVIAVLGLDDGAFPRTDSDGGIDLMARHRRLGDRDVRGDDRWLFLETVMAARQVLHLSFIGQGVRDAKPRNPAAPLAELLAALDDAHDLRGTDQDVQRPWLVRHPLQPFDPRYFEISEQRDARLYSYRADLAALAQTRAAATEPFLPDEAPTALAGEAPLKQVLEFYREPARHILRRHLGVNLEALEHSRLRESEPLEPGFDRFDRVGRRLVLAALEQSEFSPSADPPQWLLHGGLWPVGAAGAAAWAKESAAAKAVLLRAQQEPLLQRGLPPATVLEVHLELDGAIVTGELTRLHRQDERWFVFEVSIDPKMKPESELDFRLRIGLFLEWALANLVLADTQQTASLLLLTPRGVTPWRDQLNRWSEQLDAARRLGDDTAVQHKLMDLRARVRTLITIWQGAKSRPPWYFPRTSWAAAHSVSDSDKISNAWESDDNHTGERDYEPGYTQLLARDARFGESGEDLPGLVATARRLYDLIRFELDTDGTEGAGDAGGEP